MSFFNPSRQTRTNIKFYADVLQALAIIAAGLWAAFTYHVQSREQAQRAKEQAEAIQRELQRPYDEKKLSLYLDAARVLAHLAANPSSTEKTKMETRFWELYWGELAFVETQTNEPGVAQPSIEGLMVRFCHQYFGVAKCHASDNPNLVNALLLSHQASREIKDRWKGAISIPVEELMLLK
jgi:hypothetical protein